MSTTLQVKFRPPKTDGGAKVAARIYISGDNLVHLTGSLGNGKPCTVEARGDPSTRREATLWLDAQLTGTSSGAKPSPVKTTEAFHRACGFGLTETYAITYAGKAVPDDATEIVLEDITSKDTAPPIAPSLVYPWTCALMGFLEDVPDQVFPGMTFNNVRLYGPRRTFAVVAVNGRSDSNARYVLESTKVAITEKTSAAVVARPKLEITGVHGMDAQVRDLNRFLLVRQYPKHTLSAGTKSRCAMVIHGESGTGKTMLLDRVAQTGWGTVHRVKPSDKLSAILEIFRQAREQQPSIIIIDEFHRLLDKERSNRGTVIQALRDELDKLSEIPKTVVLVACQDYQMDIPAELREVDRLANAIYLPLPDLECRKAIFRSLDPALPAESRELTIARWSERTHAYSGKDLRKLMDEITTLKYASCLEAGHGVGEHPAPPCLLSHEDFERAVKTVRPTVMHDIKLQPDPIHWDDIHGQERVKQSLRHAVQLLNNGPEALQSYGLAFPKGVLLYGPPGCSKTMVAQAMATESGLNFFAVQGAELLNMYVGESERALRNLFQRARSAAPSMIFFDEIDAIGGRRGGMGSGDGVGISSHGGLNVITTMLAAMDGIERLNGVLIVAATNRPQALDPALLRPGRFDELIFVSPPDPAACKAMVESFVAAVPKVDPAVDPAELAPLMHGYSGAEIANILRSAAKAASRRSALIGRADFLAAVDQAAKHITPEMLDAYRKWEQQIKARPSQER